MVKYSLCVPLFCMCAGYLNLKCSVYAACDDVVVQDLTNTWL